VATNDVVYLNASWSNPPVARGFFTYILRPGDCTVDDFQYFYMYDDPDASPTLISYLQSLPDGRSIIRFSLTSTAVARPSVVCNARLPTSAFEIFSCFSTPYGTLAIHWHPREILRRSTLGNPSAGGGLNARGVAKYSDFWPIEGHISETVQDRRYVSVNH